MARAISRLDTRLMPTAPHNVAVQRRLLFRLRIDVAPYSPGEKSTHPGTNQDKRRSFEILAKMGDIIATLVLLDSNWASNCRSSRQLPAWADRIRNDWAFGLSAGSWRRGRR